METVKKKKIIIDEKINKRAIGPIMNKTIKSYWMT